MVRRVVVSGLLLCWAGVASADFFDFFDMGDFLGNNRQNHASQGAGNAYGNGNANTAQKGHSRGRGEADINMDFDLNFRAKGWGSGDAANRGNTALRQNIAVQLEGDWYNRAHGYGVTDTVTGSVVPQYIFPSSPYAVPYSQQGYYYPGYTSYYVPWR
jgi:hypothetical protein